MKRPGRTLKAAAKVTGTVAAFAAFAALAVPAGIAIASDDSGARTRGPGRTITVEITAHHSRFTPSSVTVAPGATVRFVVRNLDPIDHELIVGGPAVHRRHRVGREAHHHGDVPGEVSIPAGATVSTTWTAPAAATEGPVTFACHLPGHLDYGMVGTVQIRTEEIRTRS